MSLVDDHGGAVRCVAAHRGVRIAVTDSVSFVTAAWAGHLLVTGSHGGASAGEYALRTGVAAIACNDAGVGKDRAGIAGLAALGADGVPGVAVAHDSARIGDGTDTWEHGVVSYVNAPAAAAGLRTGLPLRTQFTALAERIGAAAEAC